MTSDELIDLYDICYAQQYYIDSTYNYKAIHEEASMHQYDCLFLLSASQACRIACRISAGKHSPSFLCLFCHLATANFVNRCASRKSPLKMAIEIS